MRTYYGILPRGIDLEMDKQTAQQFSESLRWTLDEIKPTDRVLDLGCAHHDVTYAMEHDIWLHGYLVEKASSVLGVDILETEVERMRELGYSAVCANVETMQLGEKFDVVVAGELIEHLSNPGLFLDRVYEHLEDHGKLILTTPYPWSFVCMAGAFLNYIPVNEEHTCWFDPITLTQVLNRHRFTVDKLKLARLMVGVRGWPISYLLCKLGLRRIGAVGQVVVCSKQ